MVCPSGPLAGKRSGADAPLAQGYTTDIKRLDPAIACVHHVDRIVLVVILGVTI